MWLRIAAAVLLVGLVIAAIAIPLSQRQNNQNAKTDGKLSVLAAENFWGDIARQVGREHVHVEPVISDPEADPHLYESDASTAGKVAKADVVITNGLGYDEFMDKLLDTTKDSKRQVVTAATVLNITDPEANPHLWYDIPETAKVADAIAASFSAKDPSSKQAYEANAAEYKRSLESLRVKLEGIRTKHNGQQVAYTERVAGYLLEDAGLVSATPEGFTNAIESGSDPSPSDTQAMESLLRERRIKVLLYNSQATSPLAENLQAIAKENNVPVVAVSETMPKDARDYQAWQSKQLDELQRALDSQ